MSGRGESKYRRKLVRWAHHNLSQPQALRRHELLNQANVVSLRQLVYPNIFRFSPGFHARRLLWYKARQLL